MEEQVLNPKSLATLFLKNHRSQCIENLQVTFQDPNKGMWERISQTDSTKRYLSMGADWLKIQKSVHMHMEISFDFLRWKMMSGYMHVVYQ